MVVCTAQQKRSINEYTSAQQPNTQLTTIPRLSHAPLSLYKADMGHGRSALRTVRTAHHHHHRKIMQSCQNFLQSTLCMHVQDSRHLERSMDASVVDAVHSCSCKGQPHANDNPYSAVRLFPQANTTDNSQTTRIQRCSSRTYAPISPSISAPIFFRRAILR